LVGYKAGNAITLGGYNTLIGFQAGDLLTTGTNNICLGSDADVIAVDDSNVISIGQSAKSTDYSISIGSETGLGCNSATSITSSRVLIGNEIGKNNTDLNNSAIVGNRCLYNGSGTSGGQYHAILGSQCAIGCTTASGLSLVGYKAGNAITTGGYNTLLGYQAGANITTGTGNICIGKDAQPAAVDANNTICIGGSAYLNGINIGDSANIASANTVRIGNSGITNNTFYGKITVPTVSPTNLIFPSGGNTNLDHFEEYSALATFTGAFDPSINVTIRMTRIGKFVALRILSANFAGNATASLAISSAVIPTNFRPTTDCNFYHIIIDQGTVKYGAVNVTTGGDIRFGNGLLTNFTAGTLNNGWYDTNVSWRQS